MSLMELRRNFFLFHDNKHFLKVVISEQYANSNISIYDAVADPGFPRGGRPPIIWSNFSENYMNMNKIVPKFPNFLFI